MQTSLIALTYSISIIWFSNLIFIYLCIHISIYSFFQECSFVDHFCDILYHKFVKHVQLCSINLYIYVYIRIYLRIYIHIHTYIYIYIYIYIYTIIYIYMVIFFYHQYLSIFKFTFICKTCKFTFTYGFLLFYLIVT